MNAMTEVTAREIQWFAVRMKPNASGGPRTAIVDVVKEQYTNRAGQKAWRKVKGAGTRVFLPEHLLKRAGFEVFLPVKKVLRIKNRFTKEKHWVSVPLLADWMFVGLPIVEGEYGRGVPGWKKLMELDVVAGVMGTGGRPVVVSEARMGRLMRQWGDRKSKALAKKMNKETLGHSIGDIVVVPDGPFEGFEFKIIDFESGVAKGVVNIFGRDTHLKMKVEQLPMGRAQIHDNLPSDADVGRFFDHRLSSCRCGFRMAQVVETVTGFCIECANCGGRAAVSSETEDDAISRWNEWRLSCC